MDPQKHSNDATVISLDNPKTDPSDNDELTFEDHEQNHKDEMNALLQNILFNNKDNKK